MALEIEKTALWADIRKVMEDPVKPVRFRFEATIHTEKEDIPVMKMLTWTLFGITWST